MLSISMSCHLKNQVDEAVPKTMPRNYIKTLSKTKRQCAKYKAYLFFVPSYNKTNLFLQSKRTIGKVSELPQSSIHSVLPQLLLMINVFNIIYMGHQD